MVPMDRSGRAIAGLGGARERDGYLDAGSQPDKGRATVAAPRAHETILAHLGLRHRFIVRARRCASCYLMRPRKPITRSVSSLVACSWYEGRLLSANKWRLPE